MKVICQSVVTWFSAKHEPPTKRGRYLATTQYGTETLYFEPEESVWFSEHTSNEEVSWWAEVPSVPFPWKT